MAERGGWKVTYRDWDPKQQPLREALCTLGNGYFATRGAAEESRAGGPHYPGTYLAGGYNRLESEVGGRIIENEDLVNWPNWLGIRFRIPGEEWFDLSDVDVREFLQELDLRRGVLLRRVRFVDRDRRESTLTSRRLVHMDDPHLAAIDWTLRPENWSGQIELAADLDGTVRNEGVERYADLNGHHLRPVRTERIGEDGILLEVRSSQSHLHVAQAARLRVFLGEKPCPVDRTTEARPGWIGQTLRVECQQEKPLRLEKTVALFTSRDRAISEPGLAASDAVRRADGFAALEQSHARKWEQLWHRRDIELGDALQDEQPVLRLSIFHLLQTASFNTIDLDVGIPSRGWHGEAYRGHVFWDELFVFPFLNFSIPELTRSLLMYRYRRLDAARRAAADAGYRGAMYPWQSGSDGREESQVIHLNPESGRWTPDVSHRQRHVNSAIAYNVWQYFQATNDMEFLSFYGAEMFLEIARFWGSRVTFNADRDRYEILHVVGPDEFHTGYPDSDELGLRNNAYTNVLAAWVLGKVSAILGRLAPRRREELLRELELPQEEIDRWDVISRKLLVPFHGEGVISQFEGYEDLKEFDWEGYRRRYGDIQRLDRILEAEGDTPNRYQVSKQADVLMLFFLFSSEELAALFGRLGYEFDPQMIPRNIDHYLQRTSHGSTLSRVTHSWVLSRSARGRSWHLFCKALRSDYSDIQGGTTPEGIHLGAMAGTVDLLQRCYVGLELRDDVLWLNPRLPEELPCVRFRLRYRGHWLQLIATHDELTVHFEGGWSPSVTLGVRDRQLTCRQGETHRFEL